MESVDIPVTRLLNFELSGVDHNATGDGLTQATRRAEISYAPITTPEQRTWCEDIAVVCVFVFVFMRVHGEYPIHFRLRPKSDGEQVISKERMGTGRRVLVRGNGQRILQLTYPLTHC